MLVQEIKKNPNKVLSCPDWVFKVIARGATRTMLAIFVYLQHLDRFSPLQSHLKFLRVYTSLWQL